MRGAAAPGIFVSAGEPSGDLHGAGVVRALRARFPGATIDAVGGPLMAEAGARIRYPMQRLGAIGFAEIVGKIPAHYRLLRSLEEEFGSGAQDLLILIDYPGFHLRVAAAARRAGLKVLYYIPPQLWAWYPSRARRLARSVDRMAVALPFEQPFFEQLGLRTDFVGHPLMDRGRRPSREEARDALGLPVPARLLGIFPGSRREEISRHWPLFREAALTLLREGHCQYAVVAGTAAGEYPGAGPIRIHRGDPLPVFGAADAALAKSGTTTLEAALADTPMVVVYRTGRITYELARRLMRVEWISLVNLVAGREVVPEFWRRPVRAGALVAALGPLLDPTDASAIHQRVGLAEVRRRLGPPGAAQRVAAIAAELLQQ